MKIGINVKAEILMGLGWVGDGEVDRVIALNKERIHVRNFNRVK